MRNGVGVPGWIRGLGSAHRALRALFEIEGKIADRAVCLLLDPARRDAVTVWAYERQPHYLPSGRWIDDGLYSWERAIVTAPPFPGSGCLLLGGAGGGRELGELCALGYSVTAFEPTDALVEGARAVAVNHPNA